MTRMLIVPSPTLDVLSTGGPLPTDGQPEWRRWEPSPMLSPASQSDPGRHRYGNHCPLHVCVPNGPFPFTVAVWQEAEYVCGGPASPQTFRREWDPSCPECGPTPPRFGAVVATVEITGPSHHADECRDLMQESVDRRKGRAYRRWHCERDALPGGWHTPTGQVSRLDVPIPIERPNESWQGVTTRWERTAPWWWEELNLEDDGG